MWIRVLIDTALHRRIRQVAVGRGLTWEQVVGEAMQLWLAENGKQAA
jgi:hypothetical protein